MNESWESKKLRSNATLHTILWFLTGLQDSFAVLDRLKVSRGNWCLVMYQKFVTIKPCLLHQIYVRRLVTPITLLNGILYWNNNKLLDALYQFCFPVAIQQLHLFASFYCVFIITKASAQRHAYRVHRMI